MDYLFENIGTNWALIAHDILSVYLPLFCLFFIGLCIWSTRNYKRSIDQEKSEELNTAQKQIDHLRLKNINHGIEIERLSDEVKTTNGALRRMADKLVTAESDVQRLSGELEAEKAKPKRNPDGTFAVTTGKGHQRKRKPEPKSERDWTQATREELLDEAKRRYPVGTVYLDVLKGNRHESEIEPEFYNGPRSTVDVCILVKNLGGFIYADGKWAQIIS